MEPWDGHRAGAESESLEESAAYCKQSGKELETISAPDTGAAVYGKLSSGEVHFRCVSPNGQK
jgi:hypothetical protein